jgi:hypothetical protein
LSERILKRPLVDHVNGSDSKMVAHPERVRSGLLPGSGEAQYASSDSSLAACSRGGNASITISAQFAPSCALFICPDDAPRIPAIGSRINSR